GEGRVGEIDAGEGELAGESGVRQSDKAGSVLGAKSARTFIRRLYPRLEDAGDGLARARLRPDGGECVRGRVAFIGAIEDFPVAQLSAAAQRDGSGRNTPE